MAPALDLAPSKAKLARAREHLKALERDTAARVKQKATHAVRFSPVDPQTGWCSISLVPQDVGEPRLSAIFGDVIHNLRCALDYVVTALADASQTKVSTKHEFPIFLAASDYAAKVGSKVDANSKGPLRKIAEGLVVVESWQPYYTQPDPRTDPLWGIHRFSNADKHREPAAFATVPVGKLDIRFNGIKVEDDFVEEVTDWNPDQDIPVGRIRFDPPRAENLRAVGTVSLDIWFMTPKTASDDELTITLRALPDIVDYVAKLLDTFGQL
jgi:hypothetical protein